MKGEERGSERIGEVKEEKIMDESSRLEIKK